MIAQTRSRIGRRLAWLATAGLTAAALLAPGATSVAAASVTPIFLPADIDGDGQADQNPTCAFLDGFYGGGQTWIEVAKFQPLANGTQNGVTISGVSGQVFDWSSTVGIDAVLVKAGSDNHALYVYASNAGSAEALSDTDLTHGPSQQGVSHVSFCMDEGSPPTPTPTLAPTPTPTLAPTPTPTGSTPTPTGGVGGATGTPAGGVGGATSDPTLPSTATIDGTGSAASGDGWRVILLVMAGLLAVALLLTPAKAVIRKDDTR